MELIDIEDTIVTADAMSCQRKIVEEITAKGADYVIGLKENQPALYEDIKLYFDTISTGYSETTVLDRDHGRSERREYRLLTDISWLEQKMNGKG